MQELIYPAAGSSVAGKGAIYSISDLIDVVSATGAGLSAGAAAGSAAAGSPWTATGAGTEAAGPF
mgnify:CR=1 FL=1